MGGKTIERTFPASSEDVYEAARRAVAELGYSVLHSDAAAKAISFNTGRSMKSWAGQDLTATVFASDDGSARVVVGGSLAPAVTRSAAVPTWGMGREEAALQRVPGRDRGKHSCRVRVGSGPVRAPSGSVVGW